MPKIFSMVSIIEMHNRPGLNTGPTQTLFFRVQHENLTWGTLYVTPCLRNRYHKLHLFQLQVHLINASQLRRKRWCEININNTSEIQFSSEFCEWDKLKITNKL